MRHQAWRIGRAFQNRLPECTLAMWVGILALGIGLHAHAATQLPLSDAFAYYFKAYNFWTAEAKSPFVNPFNIWPFFRPPGTVLMSYPFGFSADPRGFFFRSVFFPAVLLGAAVLVVSYAPRGLRGALALCRWRGLLFSLADVLSL